MKRPDGNVGEQNVPKGTVLKKRVPKKSVLKKRLPKKSVPKKSVPKKSGHKMRTRVAPRQDTPSRESSDGCGCCALSISVMLFLLGLLVAVFFPEYRDGEMIKPIVETWDRLFGASVPTLDFSSLLLVILIVAGGAGGGFGAGWVAARLTNRVRGDRHADVQLWGARASIIGLAVSIVGIILGLFR